MRNYRELNVSKKINKIINISHKMQFWLQNLYLSTGCCTRRLLSEFANNSWKLGNIDSLLRESARRVRLPSNEAAADLVWCIAVEDLVLSQEDKPKMHRSARENYRWRCCHMIFWNTVYRATFGLLMHQLQWFLCSVSNTVHFVSSINCNTTLILFGTR